MSDGQYILIMASRIVGTELESPCQHLYRRIPSQAFLVQPRATGFLVQPTKATKLYQGTTRQFDLPIVSARRAQCGLKA